VIDKELHTLKSKNKDLSDAFPGRDGYRMLERTRIVIVDEHQLFRTCLQIAFQSNKMYQVVGEASCSDEVLSVVRKKAPKIVLVDIDIPGGGVGPIIEIGQEFPKIKIIVLTAREDSKSIVACLSYGVRGYVLKSVSGAELLEIVQQVSSGGRYVPPHLAASTLARHKEEKLITPRKSSLDQLSSRDRQILEGISGGLSNKEIARFLGVSSSTVAKIVSRLFRFLNVRNRTEAAVCLRQKNSR